jgi:hypothetical protein
MARILKEDRYQKGQDDIACTYKSAKEAIREMKKDLFG